MRAFIQFCLTCCLLMAAGSLRAQSLNGPAYPPVETILSNVVTRALSVASQRDPIYNYKQTTIIEELDSKGYVKERKEKFYDVKLIGGMPRAKLLTVNGKEVHRQSPAGRTRTRQKARPTLRRQNEEKG